MITIKKETKNIITEETIERKLYTLNKEELSDHPLMIGITLIFSIVFSLIILFTVKPAILCFFAVLLVNLPFIISILYLFKLLAEPKRIERGHYGVTVQRLNKKIYVHGKTSVFLLAFNGFRTKAVDYYEYHYASEDDEYYLVYYKNSKNIKLLYPLRTHTLKESPSFKVN